MQLSEESKWLPSIDPLPWIHPQRTSPFHRQEEETGLYMNHWHQAEDDMTVVAYEAFMK
ncbi:predicted protein [Sclerotinia sclerotiorum 1980 UF-70]|uniref:Uncharacterized protein n=1 Tax=Sclerotinia sclerotiorum (strain ATCC 18683 / 1980 / Ss-1) TaxID=665079 RepID=A7EUR8_SCLS1|nr:predicted protein [Sclerotinia sclerotiorum 1980 UF-70]EDN93210.1 predicted protein [Sclerotinia sclerotiorum 1980 UF-70]